MVLSFIAYQPLWWLATSDYVKDPRVLERQRFQPLDGALNMRKTVTTAQPRNAAIQFAGSRGEGTGHRAGFFVSKSPSTCNEGDVTYRWQLKVLVPAEVTRSSKPGILVSV
ncbi:hypothetical protein [Vreelandella olivaria]|uniref:hypothetical protein n=1 Tax=Vreelandella olivaria TaxID=390919 RepID=UPI00201F8766|nr:hypothetical protein [Halomonas olivaria]